MTIHFKKDQNQNFSDTLKERIHNYFITASKSQKADSRAWTKGVILFMLYLIAYIALFIADSFSQLLFFFALLGCLKIFLALNVAHDAAHNAFSARKKTNDVLLLVFDLLGANGYMWKLRHVYSHHPYANIPDHDADIKQSGLVRIFPATPYRKIHSLQHFYMPVLYAFYTLHWLLFRDFKDFLHTPKNTKKITSHCPTELFKLVAGKFFYLTLMLVLPICSTFFSALEVVAGFIFMQIIASYTVALALASAHVGDDAVFPAPDESGCMQHSWLDHQIATTTDFATPNALVTHLYGGFNHHVIHHLFPNICHIHYPDLTKILIETCSEFGVHYRYHDSLTEAVLAHYKLLKARSHYQQTHSYPEF